MLLFGAPLAHAALLSITTTALNPPTATVGVGYAAQQAIAATGGVTPYSWSASGLPNGMAINSSSGALFGTPTVAGTFNFTVTVGDSGSPHQTASKGLSITVSVGSTPALSITTTSLNPPTAAVGVGYAAQQAIAATGGQTPYNWSASGLPNGMGINSSSGAVFGTPTVAGTFNFTVTVQDSSSPQQVASKVLSLPIAGTISVTSFGASPSTINAGQSSTLSWATTNATTVSISGVSGTQPNNGSVSVSPTTTTTYTLTATGFGGTTTAATTVTVTQVTGALDQLRFSFRNARQRAVNGQPAGNIIFLTKRSQDETFRPPVTASINDQPLTQIGVADGVLTLSGAAGGRSLNDWFPSGGTVRISITNGDGKHFAVILRRSSTMITVVTPKLDSLSSSSASPAATITLSGSNLSPVALENDVILTLPDGRLFHLPAKNASGGSLDVVIPLLPSVDGLAFYSGSFSLSIGTAPGYVSPPVPGVIVELPQLTTPPGQILTQMLQGLKNSLDARIPAAGAAMAANGVPAPNVQSLQAFPYVLLSMLGDLRDAALAGTPRSFDLETANGTERVYVDAQTISLIERLLMASDSIRSAQAATLSLHSRARALTSACGPTAEELDILIAATAWEAVDIGSDINKAVVECQVGPGSLATKLAAVLMDIASIVDHVILGLGNFELQSLHVNPEIHVRAGKPTKEFVYGVFQSPLPSYLADETIKKLIERYIDAETGGQIPECASVGVGSLIDWIGSLLDDALKAHGYDIHLPAISLSKVPLSAATTRFSTKAGGPPISVDGPCNGEVDLMTQVTGDAVSAFTLHTDRDSFPLMTDPGDSSHLGSSNNASGVFVVDSVSTTPIAAIDASYGSKTGVENTMLSLTVPAGSQALVDLSAARSSDPQHGTLTYAWLVDGIASGTGLQSTAALAPGSSHSIELIVRNLSGGTASAGLIVAVSYPLGSPTAGFFMEAHGVRVTDGDTLHLTTSDTRTTVTLSAVGRSVDPSGQGLAYSWRVGTIDLTGPDVSASLPVGTFGVTLSATNTNNVIAKATGTIVITKAQTGVPTISDVEPTVTAQPEFVILVHGQDFAPATVLASVDGPGCAPTCFVANGQLLTKTSTAISFTAHGWQSGAYQITVRNGSSGTLSNATSITVLPAPMSGTLNSPSCTIVSGASSCNVMLTWTTTNPVGTSQVTSNTPSAGTVVGNGNNSSTTVNVPHSSRTFFLYNNAVLLTQSTATSSCISGTSWNGSTCQSSVSPMSGTLTSPSCTIDSGASSCNVTLTWTTTNPVGTSQVTSNTPSAGTVVGNGNNNSTTANVPYSSRVFFLYNNAVLLTQSTATSSCISGTSWNGSTCQSSVSPMSGTLTSPSCTIASGASSCNVTLTWTTTNPVGTSQVTSNTPSAGTVVGNGNNGTATIDVPYSSRSFFLYNNAVLLAKSTATSSCTSGTNWNGSSCQAAPMSGTLSSPSCTISSGASSCNVSLT
ncbi:MAG TPA: Ig domain-containing protein, partial [Thermoanaerobaculia bacterium]|nr:Ig domain-containing protein [Thermoanaerobaculia bacterium]